jgi:hypothetical protein
MSRNSLHTIFVAAVVASLGGCTTTFNLTVTNTGSGGGTVTSNPSGISCTPTCTASYAAGTIVTLTPQPDATSVFGGWSGDCAFIPGPILPGPATVPRGLATSVTMDADKTCTARFDQSGPSSGNNG